MSVLDNFSERPSFSLIGKGFFVTVVLNVDAHSGYDLNSLEEGPGVSIFKFPKWF